MKWLFQTKWRYVFLKFGRDRADAEKVIIPTIIYINTNHESFKPMRRVGFVICFGWWDWSIKIGVIK